VPLFVLFWRLSVFPHSSISSLHSRHCIIFELRSLPLNGGLLMLTLWYKIKVFFLLLMS